MPQGFALQPVLDLEQRRLELATAQLQKLGGQRREAEAKLRQLQSSQAQYRASRQQGLAQGMEPDRLRDFDVFLVKLEHAIALQTAEVERAQQAWETEHRHWLALRAREQALGVLARRHAATLARREARNEQKQQDEFAAMKVRQAKEG
jgi:flagellar protein FliJ